jgi:hypothetical protein
LMYLALDAGGIAAASNRDVGLGSAFALKEIGNGWCTMC